ncbi:MAG: VWA domain-containing protein [Bdellovibrionaceae bacterium]|nr:VWA domain-containing protein [Pseudobdellovibrionaceae bacterium]
MSRIKVLTMGLVSAGMLLSCSPETPKAYYSALKERGTASTLTVDPRVDILFVVDNSGSMETHQKNLALNVNKFTSEFTRTSFIEYNIGVTTTDDGIPNLPNQAGDCCGHLVGNPRVVTKGTPNLNQALANNFLVGTAGSVTEMIFDPINSALTEPNLSTYNRGFYRPPAKLALIFITDAEDQSLRMSEKGLYDFLLNLKGGNADKILGYGVIVPTGDTTGCSRDSGVEPTQIEKFLSRMPNSKDNIMNLCSPEFGNRLGFLARNIVEEMTTIRLKQVPYVPSIKVKWGDRLLEADAHKGWAYDAQKNAVVLGDQVDWKSQPLGTPISIDFEVAKY